MNTSRKRRRRDADIRSAAAAAARRSVTIGGGGVRKMSAAAARRRRRTALHQTTPSISYMTLIAFIDTFRCFNVHSSYALIISESMQFHSKSIDGCRSHSIDNSLLCTEVMLNEEELRPHNTCTILLSYIQSGKKVSHYQMKKYRIKSY